MKITGRDSKDIVAWSAGGLVAGLLYQIASIWVKQKTNAQQLNPTTEALSVDQELFSLFCQLQEHRKVNEMCFRRAVDDSDRLVFLHEQLRTKQIDTSLKDRPAAFLYFKSAIQNLENFYQDSEHHPSVRVPVEVHRLYVLIFECLEKHWNAILHLTQG